MSYDDFRKAVLYAVARNGGSLYEESFPASVAALDRLDFHLHLQQMQDQELANRKWSKAVPASFSVLTGETPRKSQPYLVLTPAGWDWVRQDREAARGQSAAGSGASADTPPKTRGD